MLETGTTCTQGKQSVQSDILEMIPEGVAINYMSSSQLDICSRDWHGLGAFPDFHTWKQNFDQISPKWHNRMFGISAMIGCFYLDHQLSTN